MCSTTCLKFSPRFVSLYWKKKNQSVCNLHRLIFDLKKIKIYYMKTKVSLTINSLLYKSRKEFSVN